MNLYLMRHGIAASKDQDPHQGLTESSIDEIQRLARFLANKGMAFNQVWHSTKRRAQQTAEIISGIVNPDANLKKHRYLKPNDDPYLLLDEIPNWQQDTLVVGHLPYLPQLLALIPGKTGATEAISFEPGTVVCLLKDGDEDWLIDWVAEPSSIPDSAN